MEPNFPVRLMVKGSGGLDPLTAQLAAVELPRGPDQEGPILTYGPYLTSLSRFLGQDGYGPLLKALRLHLGRSLDLESIQEVEIISRKHGALYHVAQVRVGVPGERCSLALNVAVRPDQQAFLESEFTLLSELHHRFGLPYLPRPYLMGEIASDEPAVGGGLLRLFLAEWFDDYHEFHLSSGPGGDSPVINVWTSTEGQGTLGIPETRALYSQAAAILTGYFDERTYKQIYPWHHAAGDFVVKRQDGNVDVRLVTARDHRCLILLEPGPEAAWIAIAHFFLNLTLRVRLDRLDGTGPLAWAEDECLRGVVDGFFQAWARKARRDPSLPSEADVMEVLRSFSPEEWLPLAELIVDRNLVESSEADFLSPRLKAHVGALSAILREQEP
jgi:hypothetical protein